MTTRPLPLLLLVCAFAAGAEVTESETTTTFGNITTYRSGGGYEQRQGSGGYNDYNRYRERSDGRDDQQYNRPRSRHPEQTDTAPGAKGSQSGNKSWNTAPTRQARIRSRASRPRSETSREIQERYETPGITTPGLTRYRSPYESSQYPDRGSRMIRGQENPGYNQSNGGRPRQPVQPLEDGTLPEGGSDDAHVITR